MPTIFIIDGYRFHFFSNEGDIREPVHVHIAKRGVGDAKLWLYPVVFMAYNHGLDARTLRWAVDQAGIGRQEIVNAWHEHFGTRE